MVDRADPALREWVLLVFGLKVLKVEAGLEINLALGLLNEISIVFFSYVIGRRNPLC